MTTETELSGRELREALAIECGWTHRRWGDLWRNGSSITQANVPPFDTSLDALFAPRGPVERLAPGGIAIDINRRADEWWACVYLSPNVDALGATPAEALARACLAALRLGREETSDD